LFGSVFPFSGSTALAFFNLSQQLTAAPHPPIADVRLVSARLPVRARVKFLGHRRM